MFGMGVSLKPKDLLYVVRHPKYILIGCIGQFTVMPLLAFGLGHIFGLDTALLAGVVLVGTCPGGTASNVITYLSKGDVALSVGMTSVNTLLAPLLTSAITYLFLHRSIEVDVKSMFLSIVQVVIVPIALGLIINRFFGKYTEKVTQFMPMLSVTAICLIVMSVVSHNSEKILTSGIVILAVVILHNLSGYAVGFGLGSCSSWICRKRKRFPSRSECRIPDLHRPLRERLFPIFPWQQSPARSFRYGITYPVRYWRIFSGRPGAETDRMRDQ